MMCAGSGVCGCSDSPTISADACTSSDPTQGACDGTACEASTSDAAAIADGAASEASSDYSDYSDGQWLPGSVAEVLTGGAEVAARLTEASEGGVALAATLWHAPWLYNAAAVQAAFAAAAAAKPGVLCLEVDVRATTENSQFAYEKVRGRSDLPSGAHGPLHTSRPPHDCLRLRLRMYVSLPAGSSLRSAVGARRVAHVWGRY